MLHHKCQQKPAAYYEENHNLITAFTWNTDDGKEANSFKVDPPENETLDRPRACELPVFCTCPTWVNVALCARGHGWVTAWIDFHKD